MPHADAGRLNHRYLEGLSHVPAATSLVTSGGVAGAFVQAAIGWCPMPGDAPALMVSLLDNDSTAAAIRTNSGFRVSVLGVEHDHLADEFETGRALQDSDSWDTGSWDTGALGGPLLRAAVASFGCRLTELRSGGGRLALFGDILDIAWREDAEPLLRLNHRYRRVEELPLPMFPGFALAQHGRTTSAR